jgi:hypothetical protein
MLSNTLSPEYNSNPDTYDYDLVSRQGMESIRRQVGAPSAEGRALTIKNTVDLSAPTKANRHLVQFTYTEIDETTGEKYPVSVHAVVSRHKMATDAGIAETCYQLSDLLRTQTFLDDILVGGN